MYGTFVELPPGIFNFLFTLWYGIRETYFDLVSWIVEHTVTIGTETLSLFSIFFGVGLSVYLVYRLARWLFLG